MISNVLSKKSNEVAQTTITILEPLRNFVYTITSDNGSEFAAHEKISSTLDTDFYFARPYASWERGLNENTNGLIRQYLKKWSDFASLTENQLIIIMDKLNNRPMKSLFFATPNEIFLSAFLNQK
jgi:IS30 family transposase